jgi:hypothetical protein
VRARAASPAGPVPPGRTLTNGRLTVISRLTGSDRSLSGGSNDSVIREACSRLLSAT